MTNKKVNRVLVIDDSMAISRLMAACISDRLDVVTDIGISLSECESLLDEYSNNYLVAIVDYNLPDAQEGEAITLVQDYGIPVIVLTGTMSKSLRDLMLQKRVMDYVVKGNNNELDYIPTLVERIYHNTTTKILIVDDSDSSRDYLRSLLQEQKYNVLEAVHGEHALQQIESNPDIKLVITDYNMPVMDGAALVHNIRKNHKRSDMGIIAISGQNAGHLSAKMLKSGANDFIHRPFEVEEFHCRVSQNVDLIRQIELIHDSANRDYLTGLYNRKYLFDTGQTLFENALRSNIMLTTIMIDIDFFKNINDTYGHNAGDHALKQLAQLLRKRFRAADVIARMGGEEFCIIAVNSDHDALCRKVEAIREEIEQSSFKHEHAEINYTVSIGLTRQLADSLEQTISIADRYLYMAKNNGRNQLIVDEHAEPVLDGKVQACN